MAKHQHQREREGGEVAHLKVGANESLWFSAAHLIGAMSNTAGFIKSNTFGRRLTPPAEKDIYYENSSRGWDWGRNNLRTSPWQDQIFEQLFISL